MSTQRHDKDELRHALLDAVGDERALAEAVRRLGEPIDALASHALVLRKADGALLSSVRNAAYGAPADGSSFDEYEEHWRDQDPRFLTALQRPHEVHSDVAIVDSSVFERSGVYNEQLAPFGIRYTLFGNFSISPELSLPIAFMRPKHLGAFQRDDAAYLAAMMPSIACAFRLHELVRSLVAENHDLRAVLDHMPVAVALVGPGGAVKATNAAASAILSRGDGLTTEKGVLVARRSAEAARLSQALGAALRAARSRRGDASAAAPFVRITRVTGSPLELRFLPLGPHRATLALPDHVMAIVHDPDRTVTLDDARIAELHGLTSTEAEIAAALAMGRSLTNIAAERRCSEHTVRTHVKRILEKTGAARQADLVRILLTGPAVLHRPTRPASPRPSGSR